MHHVSLHAEMNALFKSIKSIHKKNRFISRGKRTIKHPPMTIYVTRLLRKKDEDGNLILGKSLPCNHCQKFLYMYNVVKIKYTDNIDGVNVLCELKKI